MAGWFSLWMIVHHLKSLAIAYEQKECKYKSLKKAIK